MKMRTVSLAVCFRKGKARGVGELRCDICGASWIGKYADGLPADVERELKREGWEVIRVDKQDKAYCGGCVYLGRFLGKHLNDD